LDRSAWTLALLCLATGASAVGADGAQPRDPPPVVSKVEPPSWWAGHTLNPVRLLVRGKNLRGASVEPGKSGFRLSETRFNEPGTYLWVNVDIDPTAQIGEHSLLVKTEAGEAKIPFGLVAALDPPSHFQGITADDIVYLIMPDRFSDGEPSRNAPKDAPPAANNRRDPRAFHGGDFRGVINQLPYLKELGITAIWLNPWYDNWNGLNQCDKPWCPHTYYHGYHPIDFYAVEDRFGDLATLRELVESAHALGIKVIQDQIANHVGSRHFWLYDPPLATWIHGTKQEHLQNPFRSDLLLSPHAAPAARRPVLDGWFADDLPDLNQDDSEVARYLIQNALWWVGITGIDGIREDTAQYMPRPFLRGLSAAIHRQYPRMTIVGEVLDLDPIHTSFFLGGRAGWDGVDTGLDSVFDFPLWSASVNVFTGKQPMSRLRTTLRADSLYVDPARLTTVTANHDVRRFLSFPGATLEGAMLHTAYIVTTRGIPQLYYGDEIAVEGGDDPDNRRDFPGGFPGDVRNAFSERGRTRDEQRMFAWTRDWIRIRRGSSAIRRGSVIDLVSDDDSYAFARRDLHETMVVVLSRAAQPKDLALPGDSLDAETGARLEPVFGSSLTLKLDQGHFRFPAPAHSATAFRLIP
jgi:glycosidase